ncbi:hypothetical protein H8S18_08455 [Christensenella sp. NSJ-35]|uniref:Uncharacterized protein n=1 Tax=Christensenella tenuis TaxID=2763033 RepID=A0ABR7EG38_9FIRM|nr:hypothetical protein [Christensenella tenuis]
MAPAFFAQEGSLIKKAKAFFGSIAGSSAFLLNSSLIAIPYLLFLQLVDGTSLATVLPLVIFYTLRMTGIFLLRSIRAGADSYFMMMFSLVLGAAGALCGVLGVFYFPFFTPSAILLGLSTAFIQPAFTTLHFQRQEQTQTSGAGKPKKNFAPLAFVAVFLLALMALPSPIRTGGVMLLYLALFLLALYSASRDPAHTLRFVRLKNVTVSPRYAAVFLIFFVLLIVLRIARLTFDAQELDVVTIWFAVAFLIAMLLVWLRRKQARLPLWLNLLSLANGMCGNFLFIFGSFYVGAVYGIGEAAAYVYVPFVLGMGCSMAFASKLWKLAGGVSPFTVQAIGACASLVLLMTPFYFPAGVFLVSFFFSGTSSLLNREYYHTQSIPTDRRLVSKFTMQDIGSITYQFIIAAFLLALFSFYRLPAAAFFTMTEQVSHPETLVHAVQIVRFWGCLILAALYAGVLAARKKGAVKKAPSAE